MKVSVTMCPSMRVNLSNSLIWWLAASKPGRAQHGLCHPRARMMWTWKWKVVWLAEKSSGTVPTTTRLSAWSAEAWLRAVTEIILNVQVASEKGGSAWSVGPPSGAQVFSQCLGGRGSNPDSHIHIFHDFQGSGLHRWEFSPAFLLSLKCARSFPHQWKNAMDCAMNSRCATRLLSKCVGGAPMLLGALCRVS